MLKSAILYQVMRQQDPDGKRILDVFAGKELGVMLEGDLDAFKRRSGDAADITEIARLYAVERGIRDRKTSINAC
jgi:hypothetical protein